METSQELLAGAGPAAVLTTDGSVVGLNDAMAEALGRSQEQCLGQRFGELWPEGQRMSARSLVAHAVTEKTVAMRVLDFPGAPSASLVELIEARRVRVGEDGSRRVWVHALDTHKDMASLLIPFRLAAAAAHVGLWMYSSADATLEWLGGEPGVGALFPDPTMSLASMAAAVEPDDRDTLLRLMGTPTARSSWERVRYRTEHDGWHQLAVQTRRTRLGYGGPEATFGVVRDDTKEVRRKERRQAALLAERQRSAEVAEFSSALITAGTEQQLRQVVLTRLAAAFGAAGSLLALVDEDRLSISSDAGIGLLEVDLLDGMPLDDPSPVPEAIRTGRSLFIADLRDFTRRWPRAAELPELTRLGAGYAFSITPLGEAGNPPLGAFLMAYDGGRLPSQGERTVIGTLADLAGQALRRIRLQHARVQLSVALQRAMLPELPEHLAGLEVAARYRPSQFGLDIGGDWYDAFELADGTVALEIGDVQGHDVDAAAFMGQVQLSMRAIADREGDPGTVLTRTNQLLVARDDPRFASCTMLRIDPRTGRVTGTSAGHVPLLQVRQDGSHTVHVLPGGPVLGILPDAEYGEETFTLDEDAALVMVTDGLVEGPGLTLEDGLARAGTLAAGALRDGLDAEHTADRVLTAAAGVDHADDMTVLIVRRG
ncbi:SpoIIE family protein phosphatase [Actinacidiphila rubida]|uniref:Serine phosphatase RsbU, regulator of sigma subunit n=1 Tax=Actinacidiphila rubida TaxID=310780 RepID=A0A1H8GT47_9ACTN|nr:SpoIIE family protein phosphatase [Actinacidiphila rubida]SEN46448.1 Serine phosphatase RsbU, regulator of sigma subunit [Actinacidiphila rubida]